MGKKSRTASLTVDKGPSLMAVCCSWRDKCVFVLDRLREMGPGCSFTDLTIAAADPASNVGGSKVAVSGVAAGLVMDA